MPDVLAVAYSTVSYPYSTGYARVEDVQARINAGSWDPTSPVAFPTVEQVNAWLIEGTANIDAALATRGYYVPLQPLGGWVPPTGTSTWNGIGIGAWLMLRSICASYATAYVEAARHGSQGTQQDLHATYHMTLMNDFLTRIETGADNLAAFGVGGTFAPEIDPAGGAVTGSYGTTLSDSSRTEGPLFTMGDIWGSGYEQSSTRSGW